MTTTPTQTVPDSDRDHLELWRFDTAGRISPPIQREYTRYLVRLAAFTGRPLAEADEMALKRFMMAEGKSLAPGSLGIVRRALRSFYGWAHQNGVTATNPALAVQAVRIPEPVVRTADDEVRDKLLVVCRNNRDRAIVETLFGSGMRRSEVQALEVGDVDLGERSALIRKSKTGKVRLAPLSGRAVTALGLWLADREAITTTSPALWIGRDGSPLAAYGLRSVLIRLSRRADVAFSSHDARRAFAVGWLRAEGSEVGLMAVAGWSSTSMISRYTRGARTELALAEARRLLG
jgi:integrase/recombinase XerD